LSFKQQSWKKVAASNSDERPTNAGPVTLTPIKATAEKKEL